MRFAYHPRPSHLDVVATGAFDAKACVEAMAEIMRLCDAHALAAVLVDARAIPERISIGDRFALASRLASHAPPRIAILVTEENATYTRTFEDTAANRGALVKTTASEEEARRFLGV